MKLFTLVFLSVLSAHAAAKDALIMLTQHAQSEAQIKHVLGSLPQFGAGATLRFISAANGQSIAELNVPADKRYHAPKALMKFNQRAIAALLRYVRADARPANVPFTLDEIVRYHNDFTEIVIVGAVDFERSAGALPADSNIAQSPQDSLYGARGMEERLKGKRIHWWLPRAASDIHYGQAVQRFWHLYLHHQSGALVSFTHDKNVMMSRLLNEAAPLPMTDRLAVAHESVPVTSQPHDGLSVQLRWLGAAIDLDIYGWAAGAAQPVYYAHPRSDFAQHMKDIRAGSQANVQGETIHFAPHLSLCDIRIGVNIYSGAQPQDNLQAALHIKLGKIETVHRFTLDAQSVEFHAANLLPAQERCA